MITGSAHWHADPWCNYAQVGLGDEEHGNLFLMRAYVFSPDDVTQGRDTYRFFRHPSTVYGGLLDYRLGKNGVTLHLTAEAATALQLPDPVRFSVGPEGVAVCTEHLPELLHGLAKPTDEIGPPEVWL